MVADAEGWCDGFDKGKKAGIKEVVRWIGLHRTETTREFVGFIIGRDNWQAKLKEWGIDTSLKV